MAGLDLRLVMMLEMTEAPPRGPVLGRRHQLSEIAVLGRVHEDGAIEDVGGRQFST